MAAVFTWGVRTYVAALLVPSFMKVENAVEVRALPVTNEAADHWSYWLSRIVGVFAFIAAAFYPFAGLAFIGTGRWSCRWAPILSRRCSCCLPFGVGQEHSEGLGNGHTAATWLLTAYFIVLFLQLRCGSLHNLLVHLRRIFLPLAIVLTQRRAHFALRRVRRCWPTHDPGGDDRCHRSRESA